MTADLVYGRRAVREALRGRREVLELWTTERALKAAQSAGFPVARFEIEGEKIVIYSSAGVRHEPASDFDVWREKRNARST